METSVVQRRVAREQPWRPRVEWGAWRSRVGPGLVQVSFIAGLVLAWQIVADLGWFEASLFPSPRGIAASFGRWAANGGLLTAIAISTRRLAIGYLLCLLVGIPVGMLIGRLRLAEWTLGTLVRLLQPIPGIAWVPLAVAWFLSVSETAKIFIVITGGIFPIIISTSAGVRAVPPLYLRAARTLGVDGLALFARVVFPAAVPSIVAGMRIAWAFCWRALAAAEIVLAVRTGPGQEGLGGLIDVARQFSQIDTAGMVMVVLAVLGLAADGLVFGTLERRIRAQRGLGNDE